MTQQRMTTLISMGAKVPITIRKILEERGLKLSSSDLAALIEQLSPNGSKKILSYALDIMRPYVAGLGLRIVRLSDTQVEIVIPARTRNLLEDQQVSEAVLIAAGTEAVRHIWARHAPVGHLKIDIQEMNFKKLHEIKGPCRVRMELSEAVREKALAQLRSRRHSENESLLSIFDEKDQKIAELAVKVELKWTPVLNSTKD